MTTIITIISIVVVIYAIIYQCNKDVYYIYEEANECFGEDNKAEVAEYKKIQKMLKKLEKKLSVRSSE